jgi:hypothetical protein
MAIIAIPQRGESTSATADLQLFKEMLLTNCTSLILQSQLFQWSATLGLQLLKNMLLRNCINLQSIAAVWTQKVARLQLLTFKIRLLHFHNF